LQQRLVKTGGSLVKHARYYWLVLAESHLTRRLFGSMVRWSEEAIRRHWPALGKVFLIKSGTGVRRRV